MKTVHANLKITDHEFEVSWPHMEEALKASGVKAEVIPEVKAVYYSTKKDVATIH